MNAGETDDGMVFVDRNELLRLRQAEKNEFFVDFEVLEMALSNLGMSTRGASHSEIGARMNSFALQVIRRVADRELHKELERLREIERLYNEALQQEPVAWRVTAPDGHVTLLKKPIATLKLHTVDPLYAAPVPPSQPFQVRVKPWLLECFGGTIANDVVERNHRFLEESLELVQSKGCTKSEAHQLVDYVFGRPAGDPPQEVGGVMVTLAALCLASGMDMHGVGEVELARIWTKVDQIRAKQAAKPKHGPLPQFVSTDSPVVPDGWSLAPDAPTFEMIKAGGAAARKYLESTGGNSPAVIYCAMLAAAPKQAISDSGHVAEVRNMVGDPA